MRCNSISCLDNPGQATTAGRRNVANREMRFVATERFVLKARVWKERRPPKGDPTRNQQPKIPKS